MFKKCIFILSFVLLLLIQSNAAFADVNWWEKQSDWDGSAQDGNWYNPVNWTGKTLSVPPYTGGTAPTPPDINTFAAVPSATSDVNIKWGNAVCSRLSVAPWNWAPVRLNIYPDGNYGVVNAGMQLDIGGYTFYTGTNHGTVNMYGGTLITPGPWNPTQPPGGFSAEVNGLWIGGGNSTVGAPVGYLNLYGGLITVPRIGLFRGVANLYGGALECNYPGNFLLSTQHATNRINVAGGTLRIRGDKTPTIASLIANGHIVAYGTRGDLTYGYNGGTNWTTVTAEPNMGIAWNPNPKDGQTEVGFTPTLTWSPGDYVNNVSSGKNKGHHVYFGTSYASVLNAAVPTSVNDVNFWAYTGPALLMNTLYYWRVDEVNDSCAPYLWKGKVWTFRALSGAAKNPYPPVPPTVLEPNTGFDINKPYLGWTPGDWVSEVGEANGHEVYFGTSYSQVAAATTSTPTIYRGRIQTPRYNLSNLAPYYLDVDANYYWRIDEVNGPNKWPGYVWNFTHANFYYVDKFDYPDNNSLLEIWTRDIDAETECYQPELPPFPNHGHGGGLSLDVVGHTLNFSYFNDDSGNPEYINDYYSEIRFDACDIDWLASDVPSGEPKVLTIWLLGQSGNDADPTYDRMYAMLVDTAGNRTGGGTYGSPLYNPDASVQQKTTWQAWNILLSDLNDPGVDLTAVKYLFIGFGLRCNPYDPGGGKIGGTGNVNIDNILLNQPICNPPYGPTADFSDDCFVDLADVDLFVNDWLETDANLYYANAVAPSIGPVIWYQFEETVLDSNVANSGSGGAAYDGNLVNGNASTWDADGTIGRCINLPFGSLSCVNVPPAALAPFATGGTKTGLTFTVWINADVVNSMDNWNGLIGAARTPYGSGDEIMEIEFPTPQAPPAARARISPQDLTAANLRMSDFGGRWNHYAIVKDATADVFSIYENGAKIAEINSVDITTPLLEAVPTLFRVGSRYGDTWGVWAGKMDDFRMYDYALNANQIAWIATKGTKYIYVSFIEPTDLKKTAAPNIVNFGDYAILAEQWMTEQLWPLL